MRTPPLRTPAARLGGLALAAAVAAGSARGDAAGPVCGTLALARARAADPRPAARPAAPAHAAQAPPDIAVGTRLELVRPFGIRGFTQTFPATCRAVGEHLYVFVEDPFWDTNGGTVLQGDVDDLAAVFDRTSPADPEHGIFDLAVAAFGEPPEVDGYARIFVVVTDLPGNTLGVFDPQVAGHEVPELRRDAVYLDPRAVSRAKRQAHGTLAHEFQHLIHWRWDEDEPFWVNEGLSGYAEELAGFAEVDPTAVPAFLARPEIDLTPPDSVWFDAARAQPLYGATYLLMSNLAERYGHEFTRALVAEARNGRDGIDSAFARLGRAETFRGVWSAWVVGNYASTDPQFGYAALGGRRVATNLVTQLPAFAVGDVQGQWGTEVVLFRTPGDLAIDLDGDDLSVFAAWAYAMRPGGAALLPLTLDGANRGHVAAAGIDSLALIVARTGPPGPSADDFEVAASSFVPTAVAGLEPGPRPSRLDAPYPNPCNGSVHIFLPLPGEDVVELAVFDATGRRVRTLVAGGPPPPQGIDWDGRDGRGQPVASGIYYVRLRTPEGGVYSAPLALVR